MIEMRYNSKKFQTNFLTAKQDIKWKRFLKKILHFIYFLFCSIVTGKSRWRSEKLGDEFNFLIESSQSIEKKLWKLIQIQIYVIN